MISFFRKRAFRFYSYKGIIPAVHTSTVLSGGKEFWLVGIYECGASWIVFRSKILRKKTYRLKNIGQRSFESRDKAVNFCKENTRVTENKTPYDDSVILNALMECGE